MRKILILCLLVFVLFSHVIPELEARNVPIKTIVRIMRKGWKVLFNTNPKEEKGKVWQWLGMLYVCVKRFYKRFKKGKGASVNKTKALKTT